MSLRSLKRTRRWLVLPVLLLSALCGAAEPDAPAKGTWLAITRPMFAAAIKPLADKRRADGFHVVISTDAPAAAISAAAGVGGEGKGEKKKLAFIVLIGDDESGRSDMPWYLPARRVAGYYWGGRRNRTFASDSAYGDLDGDNVPDVPVGRIPARTVKQAVLVVGKILAYERRQPSPEDLRMPFWAGAPMYGEFIDSAATAMALGVLEASAPRWLSPWVLTADIKHPLCGWPQDQPERFTRQLIRGGALAVVMGHGGAESFLSMRHRGRDISYNAAAAGGMLDHGRPTAPMIVYTCSSGNFTAPGMCMTEGLLFLPAGPVAIVGATDESHPLPNYYSGVCLMDALRKRYGRIGTLWLASQRKGLKTSNFIAERVLRHAEGQIGMDSDVGLLKRDQPLLYALLGDPATKLRLPDKLSVKVTPRDGKWCWRVDKPKGATRLHVGLRPPAPMIARLAKPPGKQAARKAATAANATFVFKPLAELDAAAEWTGHVDTEGTLRFVATGPGKLYAEAIILKRPATAAAGDN